MTDSNVFRLSQRGTFSDPLTEVLRNGARALLSQAVEAEVAALLNRHADQLTDDGRQRLVRHGHLPEREIVTGIGPVAVRCPRVRDRVGDGWERIRFSSAILPPYARRSKSLEVLIPILYLKGVSTGDFEEALLALLGKDAGGLSASTIGRLKDAWSDEHARWSKRDLSAKRYVYFWADGIHVQARLEDDAQCAGHHWRHAGGQKGTRRAHRRRAREHAILEGVAPRSQAAWACGRPRTLGCRRRARLLAGGRGSVAEDARPALLGSQDCQRPQQAAEEPAIESQAIAAGDLDGRDQEGCRCGIVETYGVKYDKAADCLTKDRDALLAFYDFPAEHWKHLRTTNPIESTFATVRHRTVRSKGCLSNKTALAMVFKLVEGAQKTWRRIDGHNQLPKLMLGVKFTDGIEVIGNSAAPQAQAAA